MKKNGFTLVELLAVIIILAIISTITYLLVGKTITNSTEKLTEVQIKNIEEAAKTYYLKEGMTEENYDRKTYGTCVNVSYLIENGYIDEILNNKEMVGSVYITYNSNKYRYDYQETICVEPPDLYDNTLTPVIYDGDSWVIADVKDKWYDYEKQEWANAVILNNDLNKKVGDPITVDGDNPDVLAMFVWIPRYEYKIEGEFGVHTDGTVGTQELPGELEVNFINTNTKKANDTYRIHPAFNFGGTDIGGIWVGKFELSHSDSAKSAILMNCTSENCSEGNNLRILPNVQSLRNNTISSFFYGIRSMSKKNNTFGINDEIIDTHMMKNSEWGAVAYLSQSKYGKYGNSDYKDKNKEIYINNSSGYYTGRSGGSYGGNTAVNTVYEDQPDVETQYVGSGFYTYDGYLLSYNSSTKTDTRNMKKIASTTGNIYGIYDMSGGSWEYVMGVFANSDGILWSGNSETQNSGFVGKVGSSGIDIEGLSWPNEKYYDIYKASSGTTINQNNACNGGICFGHASSETGSWYGDTRLFVNSSTPIVHRGGGHNNGINSGVFNYGSYYGIAYGAYTTRVVLAPST